MGASSREYQWGRGDLPGYVSTPTSEMWILAGVAGERKKRKKKKKKKIREDLLRKETTFFKTMQHTGTAEGERDYILFGRLMEKRRGSTVI